METAFSIALGISLSAACGFRVFVPLFIMSIASLTGQLSLSSGFEWIGSIPALVAFGTATIVETLAYYVPWLDHLLDVIATPAAVIAGIIASASAFTDMPPLVHWGFAIIGGGGAAGVIQGATVLARLKSTALTGGFGNFLVSTAELAGSITTSVLALFLPVLCLIGLVLLCYGIFKASGRFLFGRKMSS